MVYFYGQQVIFFFQMRIKLIPESYITVRSLAKQLAIEPYFTILIYTIEVNEGFIAGPQLVERKSFSVPAYAARQKTRAAGPLFTERSLYAPVVGKIEV